MRELRAAWIESILGARWRWVAVGGGVAVTLMVESENILRRSSTGDNSGFFRTKLMSLPCCSRRSRMPQPCRLIF